MTFYDFYVDLYSSKVLPSQDYIHTFLNNSKLPKLSQSDRDIVNAPLTSEELAGALALSPSGKSPESPGADGLSVEVYKKYADTLLPKICSGRSSGLGTPFSINE